jgi:hypothetical protein
MPLSKFRMGKKRGKPSIYIDKKPKPPLVRKTAPQRTFHWGKALRNLPLQHLFYTTLLAVDPKVHLLEALPAVIAQNLLFLFSFLELVMFLMLCYVSACGN